METPNPPRPAPWVWAAALVVFVAQLVAVVLRLGGFLEGPLRNLVPQIIISGLIAYVVLFAYVVARQGGWQRPPPSRPLILLLGAVAFLLCGLQFVRMAPFLSTPYDLASWSEPMFVLDIIKLRKDVPFYLPPGDSNTNVYTPGAPAVTYAIARLLGKPTSIVAYRWIQQFYLLMAALFAARAAWNIARLRGGGGSAGISPVWLAFFVPACFLLAHNPETNILNVYLHNDPLALLASTIAFWMLTAYAVSGNRRWLWALAIVPSLAFLTKQYLAIWAAVYIVYLILGEDSSLKRSLSFAAASFGLLTFTIGACLAVWGNAFRYWAFQVGTHIVSFTVINERLADAAWPLLLGLVGGWGLHASKGLQRAWALWIGWVVMTLAAAYTSGVTPHPSHLGPSTMVGGSFALALLARIWPASSAAEGDSASSWLRTLLLAGIVMTALAGMGYTRPARSTALNDLDRYVADIEREFEGKPKDKVLLDLGEWVYLQDNTLMKDRVHCLLTHLVPRYQIVERIQRREYDRILAHRLERGLFLYDLAKDRGIGRALLSHYREVRRIPAVQSSRNWLYGWMTLGNISVLEPIQDGEAGTHGPEQAQGGR